MLRSPTVLDLLLLWVGDKSPGSSPEERWPVLRRGEVGMLSSLEVVDLELFLSIKLWHWAIDESTD
jgi:hypothetical protein